MLVDVHMHLNDELPRSPTTSLQVNRGLFAMGGMVYGFDLIDLKNRMLVHAFRFQVFYLADEQTLLVARGAYISAQGID
jgi:hypothetical protein